MARLRVETDMIIVFIVTYIYWVLDSLLGLYQSKIQFSINCESTIYTAIIY